MFTVNEGVENVTIHTGQISVCGQEGVVGWDSMSFQVCSNARPERVHGRGLITALLVTAGAPTKHGMWCCSRLCWGLYYF